MMGRNAAETRRIIIPIKLEFSVSVGFIHKESAQVVNCVVLCIVCVDCVFLCIVCVDCVFLCIVCV